MELSLEKKRKEKLLLKKLIFSVLKIYPCKLLFNNVFPKVFEFSLLFYVK